MLLCLDIGNTHIYGGVFIDKEIKLNFRYPSTTPCTSDLLGLFLLDVLEKNHLSPQEITAVVLCSVVPSLDYSVIAACRKYFNLKPLQLKPGIKTGLKIDVKNPLELGADRIANAIAGVNTFPNKNLLIADFGTATTICAISKERVYLGGTIFPGIKLSMEALSKNTARLSDVDIMIPENVLGKSTATNLQSGIYYSQLGAIKEMITRINHSVFTDEPPLVLATGGYSHLFSQEACFDANIPNLVLQGLRLVWEKNQASYV